MYYCTSWATIFCHTLTAGPQGLEWETAPSVVFEKEVIFHFVWQGRFFLPSLSRNCDHHLSSNVHRFVILCIVERNQVSRPVFDKLPKVSSVFNGDVSLLRQTRLRKQHLIGDVVCFILVSWGGRRVDNDLYKTICDFDLYFPAKFSWGLELYNT